MHLLRCLLRLIRTPAALHAAYAARAPARASLALDLVGRTVLSLRIDGKQ
jgi:hypothetical protein